MKRVTAFDFKGRLIKTYDSVTDCARDLNLHPDTVRKLIKNGKALKRNGIVFDEEIKQ